MTFGELILLRVFRDASDLARLPIEIIKMIIRALNLRGRVEYNRRRRLPRFYDPHGAWVHNTPRIHRNIALEWSSMREYYSQFKPFYGPGF